MALGAWLIPIQKRVNNWVDLLNDYFVKCVPMKHMDSNAFNIEALKKLNVPYMVSLPLVFQTTEEWTDSSLGLHPVQVALQAAARLAEEDGIEVEVLDPRTLVPLDVDTIRASVRRTGRLVVVDEAPPTCSAAAEIAAMAVEDPATFRALKAPVQRVCAAPVPVPYSPPLEQAVVPQPETISKAIRELMRE